MKYGISHYILDYITQLFCVRIKNERICDFNMHFQDGFDDFAHHSGDLAFSEVKSVGAVSISCEKGFVRSFVRSSVRIEQKRFYQIHRAIQLRRNFM